MTRSHSWPESWTQLGSINCFFYYIIEIYENLFKINQILNVKIKKKINKNSTYENLKIQVVKKTNRRTVLNGLACIGLLRKKHIVHGPGSPNMPRPVPFLFLFVIHSFSKKKLNKWLGAKADSGCHNCGWKIRERVLWALNPIFQDIFT